jgi:hypothetical protein
MMVQKQTLSQRLDENSGIIAFIILGCVLIVLTRLPQLWGGMFFPDGDECVTGLMAKHITEGKDFPLFIYGSPYGFSIFETLPASLFFKLFGLSATGLKTAILCLWTAGWVFFVLFLGHLGNRRIAVIGGLLLIFAPGWGAVSLKAWATHVSAFAATNLSLWILAGIYRSTDDFRRTVLLLGCCLAMVVLANPIWFIAMAPFVALLLYERKKISDLIFIIFGTLGTASLILLIQQMSLGIGTFWRPPLFEDWNMLESIRLMPMRIWVAMTGTYFLTRKLTAGPATIIATTAWIISSLLALGCVAVKLFKREPLDFLTRGFVGMILITLSFSLFLNNQLFAFRYLLPIIGSLAALIAIGIDRLWDQGHVMKKTAWAFLFLLIITGAASMIEFRHVPTSGMPPAPRAGEPQAIADLTRRLLNQNIRFVYSADAMLQWQIMFASKEAIKARWIDPSDRYPEYPRAVDKAFASGEPVALVARPGQLKLVSLTSRRMLSHLEDIDGWYVIIYDPSRELLNKTGFILNQ